ncbi:MAG: hypothetical protein KDB94_09990 [Acidobacteria bacterium]|nr:hypothetical protein [Acidobacteriota bacterium]
MRGSPDLPTTLETPAAAERNPDRPRTVAPPRGRGRLLSSCLSLALAAGALPAAEPWQAACADPPAMPRIERVVPVLPQPGKWRGKGFGDKRNSDLDLEECGRKIVGLVGVRLRGNVPKMVPLELDEDDGRYKASFTYSEGAGAAVVTWNLEVESESRITGRMTIMGRADQVEADLLEAGPSAELSACECEAVRKRHGDLGRRLARQREAAGAATAADSWGWTTDPETCALRLGEPDRSLPTQSTLDLLLRADWEGELVHRERCCSVNGAAAESGTTSTYSDWLASAADEPAGDEAAALQAQLGFLDAWLEERCE